MQFHLAFVAVLFAVRGSCVALEIEVYVCLAGIIGENTYYHRQLLQVNIPLCGKSVNNMITAKKRWPQDKQIYPSWNLPMLVGSSAFQQQTALCITRAYAWPDVISTDIGPSFEPRHALYISHDQFPDTILGFC